MACLPGEDFVFDEGDLSGAVPGGVGLAVGGEPGEAVVGGL